jgi:hypothetical protein
MPMAANTNTSSALLWVNYDSSTPSNPRGFTSTIRQHVMLNHFTRKAKRGEQSQIAGKSTPDNKTKDGDTRAEKHAVNPPEAFPLDFERTPLPLAYYSPPPTPGLTNDEHRSIYKAIWWHRFSPLELPKQDEMDWTQKYRVHASELLWELARSDKTFLEIFMCFSTAKETALTGSRDLRPYFRHKGRAMSMISRDVNREFYEPG